MALLDSRLDIIIGANCTLSPLPLPGKLSLHSSGSEATIAIADFEVFLQMPGQVTPLPFLVPVSSGSRTANPIENFESICMLELSPGSSQYPATNGDYGQSINEI
jgi:hypothetical protein